MTREESLRKSLDTIVEKIREYNEKIDDLKADRDIFINELNNLIESNSTLIDYSEIDAIDPVKYVIDQVGDDDEVEVRDLADMLGMSLSTLRSRIDKSKIRKYDRYDTHGTKLVRLPGIYIKEFLGNTKSNESMIECIKYILKYHRDSRMPITLDAPLKTLDIPLGVYEKFGKYNLGDLVTRGLGRDFFIRPKHNTIQRLLFAYKIGYRLQWLRSRYNGVFFTVIDEPTNFKVRIYHKEKE